MESEEKHEDKESADSSTSAETQIENIRQKNYESQTNLITTISWAGATFIMALQRDVIAIMPSYQKITAFAMFITFTFCLIIELFASILYAKSCESICENNCCAIYYDIGKAFLFIRNFLFIISIMLLMLVVYFLVFTN